MRQLASSLLALTKPYFWDDLRSRRIMGVAALCVLLNGLLVSVPAWLWGWVCAHYTTLHAYEYGVIPLWGLILIVNSGLDRVVSLLCFRVANQAIAGLRLQLIRYYQALPLTLIHNPHSEVLAALHRISPSIRALAKGLLAGAVPATIKLFGLFWPILTNSLSLSTPLLCCLLCYFTTEAIGCYRYLNFRQTMWHVSDSTFGTICESLTQRKRLRCEPNKVNVEGAIAKETRYWWMNEVYTHLLPLVQKGILLFFCSVMLGYALWGLNRQQLSLAQFVYLKGVLICLCVQLNTISNDVRNLLTHINDLEKVVRMLTAHPQIEREAVTDPVHAPVGGEVLAMRDVTFYYPSHGTLVLRGATFTLSDGEKVAIYGPNASGKSTVCHLLLGLLYPAQGDVHMWGVPLGPGNVQRLLQGVYFLPQDAQLLSGDLQPNAVEGEPLIPIEEDERPVAEALNGKGPQLSQGEIRQRLMMECLAARPRLALLDEPFGLIDDHLAVKLLEQCLRTIPSVLFFTHRTDHLHLFDRVYTLHNGQLRRMEQPVRDRNTGVATEEHEKEAVHKTPPIPEPVHHLHRASESAVDRADRT